MPLYTAKHVTSVSDDYRDNIIMGRSTESYNMNKKLPELFHINSWLGRRCFIIGGGESLKGFDFKKLDGELTIGINKAFKYYPNSTLNYFMDSVFPDVMEQGDYDEVGEPPLLDFWKKYMGVKVFITPMEVKQFSSDIYVVRRNLIPEINREHLDHGIYAGNNSGTGAIGLAVALGSTKIFLLGYDMKAVTQTHWHSGYGKKSVEAYNKELVKYRKDIEKLVPLLDQAGVEVVNLSKDSDLRCFPFGDVNEILHKG